MNAEKHLLVRATSMVALIFLLPPNVALAVESVKSPRVEQGQLEVEHKGKFQHDDVATRDDEKEFNLGLSYGVTSAWKTKLEGEATQKRGGDARFKSVKWENTLNVLSGGGFDAAAYEDVSLADTRYPSSAVTTGVLARVVVGPTAHTANLLVKREFGARARNGVAVQYRWQSRYALMDAFEPGFELYGDTQMREAFADQTLKIGPAAFGKVAIGDDDRVGFEAAYLLDATPASHDGTVKWKLSYIENF